MTDPEKKKTETKAAPKDAPGTVRIELKHPVDHKSVTYNHLTMRTEVYARDQINVGHMHQNPGMQEATLLANLCEVPPEVIGKLRLADFVALQNAYTEAVGEELAPRKT